MELVAWSGAFLLSFCSVPELYKAYKTKKCSLTWSFLMMWLVGEIFTLIPILSRDLGLFLVFNYTLNIAIISALCYYKLRGGKNEKI